MDRIEKLRNYVDEMLLNMEDDIERRCGYVHLYGVSQACGLIAMKRGQNVELAIMAGMLHDFYSYKTMETDQHAHLGSVMVRDILNRLQLTNHEETDMICSAIYNHSDKGQTHSEFDEVLIDADVFSHCFYNPLHPVMAHEKERYLKLLGEFGLNHS